MSNLTPILLADDGMRTIKIGLIKGHYPVVVQENTAHLAEIRRRKGIIERNLQLWG